MSLEQTLVEAGKDFTVLPCEYHKLGEREQDYFTRLQAYQAPWLAERILGQGVSAAEFAGAFNEFKRYAALLTISDQLLGMVSKKVDSVWHEFILFTRDYMTFCDEFHGKYIHHQPYTSYHKGDQKADERFFRWYRRVYGDLPEIWRH